MAKHLNNRINDQIFTKLSAAAVINITVFNNGDNVLKMVIVPAGQNVANYRDSYVLIPAFEGFRDVDLEALALGLAGPFDVYGKALQGYCDVLISHV